MPNVRPGTLGKHLDTPGIGDAITGIGIVEAQPGLRLTGSDGTANTAPTGYRHFRAAP